ncbi:hypothetical protein AK830_g3359 [Neonectria ditissima]|uniref:Heterokaryon incompatibility domain-containing protein n=1 Tax=Neonectria ditissima TaxID=78410 RepID=A0A0P7BQT8_9HYPO|nr:hypothetical protein AK830_g3359 [Neonectria ditissima]
MRLINTRSFKFEEFYGDGIPERYAILSHTWEKDEVTFQDWQDFGIASKKKGFFKIKAACKQAVKNELDYLWVDTNCIDKTSSAELSEAINSMFAWYRDATLCYAYLSDVPPFSIAKPSPLFQKSRWFTRGWTLQELLAPRQLIFFAQDWSKIATRSSLSAEISAATRIDTEFLTGDRPLSHASISKKMSWLSRRVTTRIEDIAYCMLGVFDINMPLLYGEGSKAFVRLQEEIIKVSNDHTIFCWTWTNSVPQDWVSMLAPCPLAFEHSSEFVQTKLSAGNTRIFSMTNSGLSITLPLIQTWSYYFGILNAKHESRHPGQHACVPLRGHLDSTMSGDNFVMERICFPTRPTFANPAWKLCELPLFVRSRPEASDQSNSESAPRRLSSLQVGLVLVLDDTSRLLARELRSSQVFKSFDDVCLMEKTRDVIVVRSHPPDLFDATRSLLVLPNPRFSSSKATGALIRLGQKGARGCVIFLALKFSPTSDRILRFCHAMEPESWEHRRRLLVRLMARVQELQEDRALHNSTHGVAIGDGVRVGAASSVFLTFITSDRLRIHGMSEDWTDENADDIETSSIIPGTCSWESRQEMF